MTDTFPCPYHKTSLKVCEHEDKCPLMQYEEYVVCTQLTESDIARVVVAVEWRS
jgi:hypothetical protein